MVKGALILVAIAVALAILATVLRDDPPPDASMALRPEPIGMQSARSL